MKRAVALTVVFCIIFCFCGCKSNPDDLSSAQTDVVIEEVIVDETGNSTVASNNNSNGNTQNSENQNSSTVVSTNTKIDYNTIVEVDICSDIVRGYLNANDTHNQYYWLSNFSGTKEDHQTFELDWELSGGPYTVYFSENADFSNAYTVQTISTTINDTMLVPGKTYYWKAIGTLSSDPVGGGRIKVKDAPVRWISIDGTNNVRDMGGWKTESGKTVKYGMIYRGQKLETVNQNGLNTIKSLGLKTELDIRYKEQMYQTPGTGMNYAFIEHKGQYDNVLTNEPEVFKSSYKKVFNLLADESNYPFYAHCNAGADRTGTFAFIVNGVLGVSYEDLTRDFELTSFSSSGKRWRGEGNGSTFSKGDTVMQSGGGNYVAWGKLYEDMMSKYGTSDGKLSSAIENYLVNYIGVPKSQIDSFRNIMLK